MQADRADWAPPPRNSIVTHVPSTITTSTATMMAAMTHFRPEPGFCPGLGPLRSASRAVDWVGAEVGLGVAGGNSVGWVAEAG